MINKILLFIHDVIHIFGYAVLALLLIAWLNNDLKINWKNAETPTAQVEVDIRKCKD